MPIAELDEECLPQARKVTKRKLTQMHGFNYGFLFFLMPLSQCGVIHPVNPNQGTALVGRRLSGRRPNMALHQLSATRPW